MYCDDIIFLLSWHISIYFNSRCHMYCDKDKLEELIYDFNSRCHMYCDQRRYGYRWSSGISTHAVTCTVTIKPIRWGRLRYYFNSRCHMYCDICVLSYIYHTFNSRCHMYCDRNDKHRPLFNGSFNSRCHMYCDIPIILSRDHCRLSTHAVTCTVT